MGGHVKGDTSTVGILPERRALDCALGWVQTDSMARKQASGGIGWRDGNGVRIDRSTYSLGTGTFLSEDMAACEDGSLADQIALAQALGMPSPGSVSGLPACSQG